jgi:hypothetical protein
VCAYKGVVSPGAITRIVYFGKVFHPIFREFEGPELKIQDHPKRRERQRLCTDFLFGNYSMADWRHYDPDEFQSRVGLSVWQRSKELSD